MKYIQCACAWPYEKRDAVKWSTLTNDNRLTKRKSHHRWLYGHNVFGLFRSCTLLWTKFRMRIHFRPSLAERVNAQSSSKHFETLKAIEQIRWLDEMGGL